jgi:hypothetical protein
MTPTGCRDPVQTLPNQEKLSSKSIFAAPST